MGKELESLIQSRDGTVVVRPDYGDPSQVVSKVIFLLGNS